MDSTRRSISVVLASPVLIITELVWRWAFAVGAIGVLLTYASTVRDAISLSATDQNAIFSGDVMRMAEVGTRVVVGALPYFVTAAVSAAPKIALIWWICATLGRGPVLRHAMHFTVKPAVPAGRRFWTALAVVQAIRILLLLIILSAFLLAGRLSALVLGNPDSPNIVAAFLVFFWTFVLGCVLWSLSNLVASNASLFVAASGEAGGLDAVVLGLRFTVENARQLWVIAGANALLRTAAAVVVTIVGILLIPLLLHAGWTVNLIVFVVLTLGYCVISDVLLLARTVSYMRLAFGEPTKAAAIRS